MHELLRYLEAVGFDATPRVLGIDREGREILSFVPGDSGARAGRTSCPTTASARTARLLRRYHDAVRTYLPTARRDLVAGDGCTGARRARVPR